MKTLNYVMSAGFGIIAVACLLVAIFDHRFDIGCLSGICFTLAWVAWKDYKSTPDDE